MEVLFNGSPNSNAAYPVKLMSIPWLTRAIPVGQSCLTPGTTEGLMPIQGYSKMRYYEVHSYLMMKRGKYPAYTTARSLNPKTLCAYGFFSSAILPVPARASSIFVNGRYPLLTESQIYRFICSRALTSCQLTLRLESTQEWPWELQLSKCSLLERKCLVDLGNFVTL